MKGFDPKFKDFPDFIIGITKEIWEDRRIAALNEYYSSDIIVRSPSSVVVGNKDVISATMATLAEFPDRELLGEDVIWSGTPEKGMLSSHRILSTATHLGSGIYGPSTGKKLKYRIIADCHAINNQINDEWIIRDQGAIIRQLGIKPRSYALKLIEKNREDPDSFAPLTLKSNKLGPYKGKGNDNQWGEQYKDVLTGIMNADLSIIPKFYDRACILEYPSGVTGYSHDDADRFWMGLRASFPSATFSIDHQIGREDKLMPPRAAIRWSLAGKHDGHGMFGKPTGAEVYIMGMSHVEFGPWGIRREYVLFDETAIWSQIVQTTG